MAGLRLPKLKTVMDYAKEMSGPMGDTMKSMARGASKGAAIGGMLGAAGSTMDKILGIPKGTTKARDEHVDIVNKNKLVWHNIQTRNL